MWTHLGGGLGTQGKEKAGLSGTARPGKGEWRLNSARALGGVRLDRFAQ